jgi:hypothetical protein
MRTAIGLFHDISSMQCGANENEATRFLFSLVEVKRTLQGCL